MPKKTTQPPRKRSPKKTGSLGPNVIDFLAYKETRKLPEATLSERHKETVKKQPLVVKQEVVFVSDDETFPKVPTVFKLHRDYIVGKKQEIEIVMLPFGSDLVSYIENTSATGFFNDE